MYPVSRSYTEGDSTPKVRIMLVRQFIPSSNTSLPLDTRLWSLYIHLAVSKCLAVRVVRIVRERSQASCRQCEYLVVKLKYLTISQYPRW